MNSSLALFGLVVSKIVDWRRNRFSEIPSPDLNAFCRKLTGQRASSLFAIILWKSLSTTEETVIGRNLAGSTAPADFSGWVTTDNKKTWHPHYARKNDPAPTPESYVHVQLMRKGLQPDADWITKEEQERQWKKPMIRASVITHMRICGNLFVMKVPTS